MVRKFKFKLKYNKATIYGFAVLAFSGLYSIYIGINNKSMLKIQFKNIHFSKFYRVV